MKKFFSFLLVLILVLSLCACAADPATDGTVTDTAPAASTAGTLTDTAPVTDTKSATDTQPATDTSTVASTEEVRKPTEEERDLVIACDQVKNRVVVYDMATYDGKDLDKHVVWSYTPPAGSATNISGVKFRRDTVFGDVILIVCSGGYAGVIQYPSKKVIWTVSSCGNNPHSIEILPSGNVVTAASTGKTLRLYHVSALLNGGSRTDASKYQQIEFADAHGVLWDPEYQTLWAIGGNMLRSFIPGGEGTEEQLYEDGTGWKLPSSGAHDLSADMLDKNGMWITLSKAVIRFDKKTKTPCETYAGQEALSRGNVKGFGNNIRGNFFFCIPNGGPGTAWETKSIADWCTDEIFYAMRQEDGSYVVRKCKSGTCAYYKVFCFAGQYQ